MKKITKVFLIAVLFVMSLTLITACDDTDQEAHTHNWSNWVADNSYIHTRNCECGENETNNHSWNNGILTEIPTCISTGIKTFTCVDCGQTKTETIEIANTHSWNKWTADGYETHSHTCSVCNEHISATHNFQNNTCADCGYKTFPATIQSVENAEVDFSTSTVNMLVDKSIRSVNLSTAVNVSLGSSWKLYTDDSNLIATKLANLKDGENTFLIVVTSSDGLYDNTYTLTIYKSFEISVEYYGVYNNLIKTETADTGYEYNVAYTPQITGYTFNHWKSHDTPITKFTPYDDVSLYADCTANEYVFRFNVNGGDELMNNTQLVVFDSSYVLPIPTRTGYTWLGWFRGETQITDVSGASLENSKIAADTEITANWEVNTYTVMAQSNNSEYGTVNGSGDYDYDSTVTLTASTYLGCIFLGWYESDNLISNDTNYTYSMPAKNITYTAQWEVDPEMQAFEFTSDTENCTITGLRNKSLTEVIIPNSVTVIGNDAFKKCNNLTNIIINKSVTSIGSNAFYECNNLTNIEIPNSVTSIGKCAFDSCSSLTRIEIPSNVTKISTQLFRRCSNLTNITIPYGVTSIGQSAFSDCSNLKSIIIPSSVTIIEERAFSGCSSLTNIEIPNGVTNISLCTFSGCSSLTNIVIPNTVISIETWAFSDCSSLMSVTIPNSVTSIGSRTFLNCNNLTIFCEATSKPSDWNEDWNMSSCPVIWNCNAYDIATEDSIYTNLKNKNNIANHV